MSTLLFLVDGIGKDKYMKLLYVVDVCNDKNKTSVSYIADKEVRHDRPYDTSGTLACF